MEQFFANESVVTGNSDIVEIYMNDEIMEENVSVQT
jgi:hypothetical protein